MWPLFQGLCFSHFKGWISALQKGIFPHLQLVPHPRCGVVRFSTQLFSSPGTLLLAGSTPHSSLECPTPIVPGVPNSNPRFSLQCPTPESPSSVPAVPQSFPEMPNPSLPELPSPRSPRSAQPQNISTKRGWGCSKKKSLFHITSAVI